MHTCLISMKNVFDIISSFHFCKKYHVKKFSLHWDTSYNSTTKGATEVSTDSQYAVMHDSISILDTLNLACPVTKKRNGSHLFALIELFIKPRTMIQQSELHHQELKLLNFGLWDGDPITTFYVFTLLYNLQYDQIIKYRTNFSLNI